MPGGPLQVGDEDVTEGEAQRTPQRGAVCDNGEGVGPAKHLMRDELDADAISVSEPALPAHAHGDAAASDVAIPEAQGRGTLVADAQAEDGGDFVDGFDFDAHAARRVGERAHGRIGEERREAQNTLRFRAQPLAARLSS